MEECPDRWEGETLDAAQGHIVPGFVDAHCHLGMFGDALGFEGDDGNESTDPCTPHLRAIDAVNPLDRCFEEARAAGVTTVVTGPGSANPIAGQLAALKTAGRWVDEMVLLAPAAMKLALGENPKSVYNERHETPTTRMATAALIRENLSKALEYGEKLDRAREDEEADKPDYDARLEALLPVVRGELPVHIHAHRADDIATGVRIAREFGLKCVILHGTEAHLIPELLEREGVPVVTGPHPGGPLQAGAGQPDHREPGGPHPPGGQDRHLHRPPGGAHPVSAPVRRPGGEGGHEPGGRPGRHHHSPRPDCRHRRPGGLPDPRKGRRHRGHERPPHQPAQPGAGGVDQREAGQMTGAPAACGRRRHLF